MEEFFLEDSDIPFVIYWSYLHLKPLIKELQTTLSEDLLGAHEIFRIKEIKEQKLLCYEMFTKGHVLWTHKVAFEVNNHLLLLYHFSQLSYFALETIVTDATYNTNSIKYGLYEIMGVVYGTSFPLSYLLVSAGKNVNSRNFNGLQCQFDLMHICNYAYDMLSEMLNSIYPQEEK
ncbi:hypothetical protein GLOIN_2v1789188 [Rhizophagus clarus]|uniref:MULE transposase domain-containing protein n=1 Tax=Rhizophagus clarus TaxID=94130 RepID=A0A8H3QGQ5_9GLOM|nr:hypothetical protein GLOIN_2v1789188 [Rhizophagus clarus]